LALATALEATAIAVPVAVSNPKVRRSKLAGIDSSSLKNFKIAKVAYTTAVTITPACNPKKGTHAAILLRQNWQFD
jgi:hypothetical protein